MHQSEQPRGFISVAAALFVPHANTLPLQTHSPAQSSLFLPLLFLFWMKYTEIFSTDSLSWTFFEVNMGTEVLSANQIRLVNIMNGVEI